VLVLVLVPGARCLVPDLVLVLVHGPVPGAGARPGARASRPSMVQESCLASNMH